MPGGGQKWLIFRVKIRQLWQASSRAGNQPGNHFVRHITSQYMGQHDLRPFLTTPVIYLCREGVKNGSFLGSKSDNYFIPHDCTWVGHLSKSLIICITINPRHLAHLLPPAAKKILRLSRVNWILRFIYIEFTFHLASVTNTPGYPGIWGKSPG